MSDLVCDREFAVGDFRVIAEWMRPTRWRGDWRCEWIVHWAEREPERGYSVGHDSTQALLLGMARVSMLLEDVGAIYLDGKDGLGLPTFSNLGGTDA